MFLFHRRRRMGVPERGGASMPKTIPARSQQTFTSPWWNIAGPHTFINDSGVRCFEPTPYRDDNELSATERLATLVRLTMYVAAVPKDATAFRRCRDGNRRTFYWGSQGMGCAVTGHVPVAQLRSMATDGSSLLGGAFRSRETNGV
jgi:hypothetical protein